VRYPTSNANRLRLSASLITFCALVACTGHRPATENTTAALRTLHAIMSAESIHQQKHRQYADLTALGPGGSNLIASDIASGHANGYEFHIDASERRFSLTAWPTIPDKTGLFSYYCDETGIIRQSWGDARATRTSPSISGTQN